MQKGVLHVSLFPSDLKLHQHPLTGFVTMFEENPREDTFFPLFFFFSHGTTSYGWKKSQNYDSWHYKKSLLQPFKVQWLLSSPLPKVILSLPRNCTGLAETNVRNMSWEGAVYFFLKGQCMINSAVHRFSQRKQSTEMSFKSHNAHYKHVNLSKESWKWKHKGNCIVSLPWNTRITQILSVFSQFLSIELQQSADSFTLLLFHSEIGYNWKCKFCSQ